MESNFITAFFIYDKYNNCNSDGCIGCDCHIMFTTIIKSSGEIKVDWTFNEIDVD
jgi:hypothetical protein